MPYDNRYGYQGRDYQDRDRFGLNRDRDDRDRGYRADRDERGFFDRAGDEVRSWFGDDEAERRRQADERRDPEGTYHYRPGPAGNGWGNQTGSQFGRRPSSDYGQGGYGQSGYGTTDRTGYSDYNRSYGQGGGYGGYGGSSRGRSTSDYGSHHEPEYRSWRERRMSEFDRDYDDYRQHRQSRFNSEFEDWRTSRNTQAGAVATGSQWSTKVKEHQEVLGSDGEHVGTVDHVDGDSIKLAKTDPASGGHHRLIPLSSIASVDSAVRLNQTAAEAKRDWTRPKA